MSEEPKVCLLIYMYFNFRYVKLSIDHKYDKTLNEKQNIVKFLSDGNTNLEIEKPFKSYQKRNLKYRKRTAFKKIPKRDSIKS